MDYYELHSDDVRDLYASRKFKKQLLRRVIQEVTDRPVRSPFKPLLILGITIISLCVVLVLYKHTTYAGDIRILKGDIIYRNRIYSASENPHGICVAKGSLIETNDHGTAEIKLKDGSIVWLSQSTKIIPLQPRRLSLISGEIFVDVARRQDSFTIEMNDSVISVLATILGVEYEDDATSIMVLQGSVKVDTHSQQSHTVDEFEKIVIRQDIDKSYLNIRDLYVLKEKCLESGFTSLAQEIDDRLNLDPHYTALLDIYTTNHHDVVTSIPCTFDFSTSPEKWRFSGRVAHFDVAQYKWLEGRLGLSPADSTNCFSYFYSPQILVRKDRIYRVIWSLSSGASEATQTPEVRLRVNQLGTWAFASTTIKNISHTDAHSRNASLYEQIFFPDIQLPQDTMVISFEINNIDTRKVAGAWIFLDKVHVEGGEIIPVQTLRRFSFDSDAEGWRFTGKSEMFDVPVPLQKNSSLLLSPQGSTNSYSYWLSPDISIKCDAWYKVTFTVGTDVNDPSKALDFNLRCIHPVSGQSWATGTFFSKKSIYPSRNRPRTFQLVIAPECSNPDDVIQIAFDLLSFDKTRDTNSWIYLEDVMIEEVVFSK